MKKRALRFASGYIRRLEIARIAYESRPDHRSHPNGGGGMPAFAGSLTPAELDDLATFLQSRH